VSINQKKWKLLRVAGWVQKLFQNNFGFMSLLFLLNYTTMAWSLLRAQEIELVIGYGFSLFMAVTAVMMLMQIFPTVKIKNVLKGILLFISGLPFLIEMFAMYNYKALIGAGIINAVLETNSHEAVEFWKMYIGFQGIAAVVGMVLFLVFVQRYRILARIKISRRKQNRLVFLLLLVSSLTTLRICTAYVGLLENGSLDLPVQRTYTSLQTAINNIEAYQELSSKLNVESSITDNKSEIPQVVFILGEATNRQHMHLYGYNLPNTPNLDEMKRKNEISVFTDCISPHSTTVAVLRDLFTFADYESDKEWYEYNNLIDVMNNAGYKTFWLSNQESAGIWGNVAQLYAKRSTKHEFTRLRDSHEDFGSLDGELFPMIDGAMQEQAAKNFYVIHLMGGHSLYYSRFPYSFAKFTKDDITREATEEQKIVLAQYANAIYYNDYIVSGIIDKFREQEALVIYLPDHGETIYDNSNFAGHVEENPNRYMLEVPMIIWASDLFKAKYPEKWRQIQAAVNKPYMTDDMIHTVLDLVDIKTSEFDPAKSIINSQFDASRKRMVQGRDYDTEIKPVN